MADYELISYDVADSIATLTMNRPDRLNAVNGQMLDEMIDAFDQSDGDDNVRVVIVTGAGRAFSAGADLGRGAETFDYQDADGDGQAGGRHRDGGGLLTLRIFESLKPVIAAINGPAVGFGITMTLPMDIRLASTEARIGFVFSQRGLVPEACSTWFLPRLVGMQQAAEWAFSGRVFAAAEAHQGGLVRSLHASDELLPAARELAGDLASRSSAVSVALTRHMMWKMLGADHPMEAHKVDSRAIWNLGKTADAVEGVTSFLEKRAPKFPGRPSTDMPDFFPWSAAPPFA